MIQARDQAWGKFGLAEVKALERGGRGKESANFCNLASIQETEDDSGVAREAALLQRSQVFRFAKLLNLSRISNFKGTLEKNSIGHKIGTGYFFTGFANNSRS